MAAFPPLLNAVHSSRSDDLRPFLSFLRWLISVCASIDRRKYPNNQALRGGPRRSSFEAAIERADPVESVDNGPADAGFDSPLGAAPRKNTPSHQARRRGDVRSKLAFVWREGSIVSLNDYLLRPIPNSSIRTNIFVV